VTIYAINVENCGVPDLLECPNFNDYRLPGNSVVSDIFDCL